MAGTTKSGQKTRQSGQGNREKSSPIAVEKYIKGTNFPADKGQLVQQAKKNNAPTDVINILNKFEEKKYNTPIDISKEVSKVG